MRCPLSAGDRFLYTEAVAATALVPLPEYLAPEPPEAAGALIGYARVSAGGRPLGALVQILEDAGCVRVFTDESAGRNSGQPELGACLDHLRPGDVLAVASLDQLSGSLQDLITAVVGLRRRGVGFRSLHEALDTTTPGGRLVFHVFAALAEFIREVIAEAIAEGTREGLDAARGRGVRLGRPPAMGDEEIRRARGLLTQPGNTVASIARLLGVSRTTIYKYLPELADAGLPAGSIPAPGPAGHDELAPASLPLPAVAWAPYQSRPGRNVLVATRLEDLSGPTAGLVELPLRLFWSGSDRVFDLDDPAARNTAYEAVLGESVEAAELAWLNGRKLAEVWPRLFLPRGVRRAWEEQHPVLRAAREAA
jgi:DNA invertase Pin-like site-specific DNA recombinase